MVLEMEWSIKEVMVPVIFKQASTRQIDRTRPDGKIVLCDRSDVFKGERPALSYTQNQIRFGFDVRSRLGDR